MNGFPPVSFKDALQDISAGNTRIPKSEFAVSGSLPIVDQGRELIAGYTDCESARAKVTSPVIIFGDHTRAIKYIDFPFAVGADGVKILEPNKNFVPKFLYHYLRSHPVPSAGYSRHFKFLRELDIPQPSLAEQGFVVSMLDRADAVRGKQQQILDLCARLAQAIFQKMFGESRHGYIELGSTSEVSSGITKGRRTSKPTIETPYLAVANVQSGYLHLDEVKTIGATEAEIARYALESGDIVLTEGGDPDKLGRGTVWRNELPTCIHQNHIFRVRAGNQILPDYLSAYLASHTARSHFLRSAKQTTGIASINITQLRATPILVPPISEQELFVTRIRQIAIAEAVVKKQQQAAAELFASLQSRAFRGEL